MSTEFLEDLGDMAATLTGSSGVADDASDDTELPNALAAQVEEYDRFVEGRDAHLADAGGEEADTDADPTPKPKQVPLPALQEERQRRQQMAAELERERATSQQMRQQFDQALALQQQQFQAQQAAQIPEFADDPEGHVNALRQQFTKALADMQGQQQQAVQRAQVQQVVQAGTQAESSFMAEVGESNYREAFDAVHNQALQALRQAYPQASEAQLMQAQQQATMMHVQQALARGENPARLIYEYATKNGFKPGHRAPGQRPVAPTSLSSLPGAGGVEAGGKLTAAKINAMSDAEFEALVAGMRKSAHSGPRF